MCHPRGHCRESLNEYPHPPDVVLLHAQKLLEQEIWKRMLITDVRKGVRRSNMHLNFSCVICLCLSFNLTVFLFIDLALHVRLFFLSSTSWLYNLSLIFFSVHLFIPYSRIQICISIFGMISVGASRIPNEYSSEFSISEKLVFFFLLLLLLLRFL